MKRKTNLVQYLILNKTICPKMFRWMLQKKFQRKWDFL